MNQVQMNAAKEEMLNWLAHPQELGAEPAELECAGEFDLHDLHYYIFKYKKSVSDKWLLGVCGGYAGNELEHCGHVFSEMEEYNTDTAEQQAIDLVETIRNYWIEQAKQVEEHKKKAGNFVSFVLLEKPEWDKAALQQILQDEWGIIDAEPESAENDDENSLIINYQGAMLNIALIPGPIPGNEATEAATENYMWQAAVQQTSQHTGHLLVAVLGIGQSIIENGEMLVKLTAAACKQPGALGVYANGVVYPPDYYQHFAGMLKENLFPIYNLVWFGLYKSKKGFCAYTNGLQNFGFDEIEVLDSSANPNELHDFLSDIANYVITQNVLLQDGETIGFSAEEKLPISKNRGVAVPGESLKIAFKPCVRKSN